MKRYGVELDSINDDKQWLQHVESIVKKLTTEMPSMAIVTEVEHESSTEARAT